MAVQLVDGDDYLENSKPKEKQKRPIRYKLLSFYQQRIQ